MATRLQKRQSRGARAVALIAYLAAITCLPPLHARTEVLRSQASVETGHTQACPVLHGGDGCTFATTILAALLPTTSVRAALAPGTVHQVPSQAAPVTARHRVRQNAVRAPPLA
ncbi:MAG: hypothetical protein OEO17_13605 [Gemmatimonadota bacterium]|nr:hypothetical protein [Gemmatimonadota bacterium]